jgi:hypothetical protein
MYFGEPLDKLNNQGLWGSRHYLVCCWFPPLFWGFFSRFSGFPPSVKINTSKFQLDLVEEEPLCGMTVNSYLFILFYFITYTVNFQWSLIPGRNGIWKCWFLLREENQTTPKKLWQNRRGSTTTHIWHWVQELNTGHSGERWVLSSLHHSYLPSKLTYKWQVIYSCMTERFR